MTNSCIIISNLPPNINSDKLIIYFQKRKNGGGDVENVKLLDDGKRAVIQFEEEETVKTVLQKDHNLNGRKLKVEKFAEVKQDRVFNKIQAKFSFHVIDNISGKEIEELCNSLNGVKLSKNTEGLIVSAESLDELERLKKSVEDVLSRGGASRHPSNLPVNGFRSHDLPAQAKATRNQLPLPAKSHDLPRIQSGHSVLSTNTPRSQLDTIIPGQGSLWSQAECGTRRKVPTNPSLTPSSPQPPFPQPEDGQTFGRVIHNMDGSVIKRRFDFPDGEFNAGGKIISYPAYCRVARLPDTGEGEVINEMLTEAFKAKKLFYIGKNRTEAGYRIYCVHEILGSQNENGEVDLTNNMLMVKSWLYDLDIQVPSKIPRTVEGQTRTVIDRQPSHQMEDEPMDTSPSLVPKANPRKLGPYPQPDGLVSSSEMHEKDLQGFPKVGAIHMYFRFPGGPIKTESGQKINYLSYNRVACLPATEEGKKLYAMVQEAAKKRKLFVIATKNGKDFMIRIKVDLLLSNEYPPHEEYFQELYASLLKLGITDPIKSTPLPPKVEAHYEEVSDDEEPDPVFTQIKNRGPHPQPEKGDLHLEKEENIRLNGVQDLGVIKMYFRFAGGKMKIQGSKPSKSYEVQYSQYHFSAALPSNNVGRQLVVMVQKAFNQKKLFYVEKREGEPSFRIRPRVKLLTVEDYLKPKHLTQLSAELQRLGIAMASTDEVNSLIISKPTTPQGGALPPQWRGTEPQIVVQPQQPVAAPRYNAITRSRSIDSTQRLNNSMNPSLSPPKDTTRKVSPRIQSLSSDNAQSEEDVCAICLVPLSHQATKTLPCKHTFHMTCVDMALKQRNKCPMCNQPLGGASVQSNQPLGGAAASFVAPNPFTPRHRSRAANFSSRPLPSYYGNIPRTQPTNRNASAGNQPINGVMKHRTEPMSLRGYEGYGTICIRYEIPAGVQGHDHPHPGQPYRETKRDAYLPDTAEGRDLLRMLKQAFSLRLTFTVGRSESSGRENQVIWNGIPHKTNRDGGIISYGYPDSNYFQELRTALTRVGIM